MLPTFPVVMLYLDGLHGISNKNREAEAVNDCFKQIWHGEIPAALCIHSHMQGMSCKPYDYGVSCLGIKPHERITWKYSTN